MRYAHGTILHTRKDLAVSLFNLILTNLYEDSSILLDAILFRVNSVSARTSSITTDGYYPLRLHAQHASYKVFKVIKSMQVHLLCKLSTL